MDRHSAGKHKNLWTFPSNGKAYTSVYDPSNKEACEALVHRTQGDTFGPGISMDADADAGQQASVSHPQPRLSTGVERRGGVQGRA